MIDYSSEIRTVLLNNPVLQTELTKFYNQPAIFNTYVPEDQNYKNPLPRIVIYEINNAPSSYADNDIYSQTLRFQISIFTKYNPTAIKKAVDEEMRNLGFFRTSSSDQFDEETKTIHIPMRYRKEFY